MAPTVTYRNVNAGERLNMPYPRAAYRATFVRQNRVQDWFTSTGISGREWRQIVADLETAVPRTGLVFQLGTAAMSADDTTAVLDMRVSSQAGAATVQDLVNALNDVTPFAKLATLERFPEVPGFSSGGPATMDAGRVGTQQEAQAAEDAKPSVLDKAGSAAAAVGRGAVGLVGGALLVGAIVLAFLLVEKVTD